MMELFLEARNWFTENAAIILPTVTVFATAVFGYIKNNLSTILTKKVASKDAGITELQNRLALIEGKMLEGFNKQANDTKLLGETINTLSANAKLPAAAKIDINSKIKELSAMDSETAQKLQANLANGIEAVKENPIVAKLTDSVKQEGTSILSRFLGGESDGK
jgi:hypothetical protein